MTIRAHIWHPSHTGIREEKTGMWYRCVGCEKSIFRPDGISDFQHEIRTIMAWNEEIFKYLDPEELRSRAAIVNGKEIGYHAVLSTDCDAAARFHFETKPCLGPCGVCVVYHVMNL